MRLPNGGVPCIEGVGVNLWKFVTFSIVLLFLMVFSDVLVPQANSFGVLSFMWNSNTIGRGTFLPVKGGPGRVGSRHA
jgi:hypothetical protein